jgi:adenine/guanine phosphoribosyltransferase-like PRPP-binding protein
VQYDVEEIPISFLDRLRSWYENRIKSKDGNGKDKNSKSFGRNEGDGSTLSKLIELLQTERNPRCFKDDMLMMTQLYFDGLIDSSIDTALIADQRKTLETLLRATKICVSGFYRSKGAIDYDAVLKTIMPCRNKIIMYGSEEEARIRHLINCEYKIDACINDDIIGVLGASKIDLIIPVASGGFEPALLIADYIEVNRMLPVRYSINRGNDDYVMIPQGVSWDAVKGLMENRNVLIVDDISETGITAKKVAEWVVSAEPKKAFYLVVDGNPDRLGVLDFKSIDCDRGYGSLCVREGQND